MAVSILGFGIEVSPANLSPWCDSAQAVTSTEMLEQRVAEALGGVERTPLMVEG